MGVLGKKWCGFKKSSIFQSEYEGNRAYSGYPNILRNQPIRYTEFFDLSSMFCQRRSGKTSPLKKNAKDILKTPKTSRHLPIHHCPTCNMAARPLCRSATDQRRCAPVRSMAAFCAAEAASCWAKPFRPGRQKWVNLCDLQIGVEVFMHWKSLKIWATFNFDGWFVSGYLGGFEAFLSIDNFGVNHPKVPEKIRIQATLPLHSAA